jgi:hypothetical protein
MIPIDMTQLHDEEKGIMGDCWRCCIASILELPAGEVPHFVELYGNRYLTKTRKWLEERGFWLVDTAYHCDYPGYLMGSGPSPRDRDLFHVVVWRLSGMVHDPHPSRDGIWGPPQVWSIILPIDVSVQSRKYVDNIEWGGK